MGNIKFGPESTRLNFDDASVALIGRTVDGKNYELSGEVSEANIVVNHDYEDGEFWSTSLTRPIRVSETYWLKFKLKQDDTGADYMYKVQMETVEIERAVSVPIEANTLTNINAAQALAGAPDDAEVIVTDADKVTVLFAWKETVVK